MYRIASACRPYFFAWLAAAVVAGVANPATAGFDESVDAVRQGEFMEAIDQIVIPVRETLEDGICEVVATTMPGIERGIASLEALVGDTYYFGHFVGKDYATAVKWYLRAAEKHNALAQSTLGDIYYYGRGVPQNYIKAATWWQLAADQGVAIAQLNLSVLYGNGEGVTQDFVKSHVYANLAAAQLPLGKDYEIAVKNREYIASQMTPEQIAEAQRRSDAWQATSNGTDEAAAEQPEDGTEQDPEVAGDRVCQW